MSPSSAVCVILEIPSVASKTVVELMVHVSPNVYCWTVVSPVSAPSYPRFGCGEATSARIREYLPHTWFEGEWL